MAQTLLSSMHNQTDHDALVESKRSQATYYNRGAKDRPTRNVGDTVRTRRKSGSEWEKTNVTKVPPYRSYELQIKDGLTRRTTKKHVWFSREPLVSISDDGNDDSTLVT